MSNLYNLAFEFYQTLKTAQNKLGNGVALANTEVFYLLANAGWNVSPVAYAELIDWYEIMGLPPAIIVSGDSSSETKDELETAGFALERRFSFRKPLATEPDSQVEGQDMTTEQVSWTQLGYAGELLAERYEVSGFATAITKGLTKATQSSNALSSYLAYQDKPVGTMTTFATSEYLLGTLLVDEGGVLEARLIQEADVLGLEPLILEAPPKGTSVKGEGGLERWSIR